WKEENAHYSRVVSLNFQENLMFSGAEDGVINVYDIAELLLALDTTETSTSTSTSTTRTVEEESQEFAKRVKLSSCYLLTRIQKVTSIGGVWVYPKPVLIIANASVDATLAKVKSHYQFRAKSNVLLFIGTRSIGVLDLRLLFQQILLEQAQHRVIALRQDGADHKGKHKSAVADLTLEQVRQIEISQREVAMGWHLAWKQGSVMCTVIETM
ncbi:hypothetical protein RFI_33276, partial [Reticulomyxa filosa]